MRISKVNNTNFALPRNDLQRSNTKEFSQKLIDFRDPCLPVHKFNEILHCDQLNFLNTTFCNLLQRNHPECFTTPEPADPCDGVVCNGNEHCENGICVTNPDPCNDVFCDDNQYCDNGICVNNPDPCDGVVCDPNYLCEPTTGVCEPDLTHKVGFGEVCDVFSCIAGLQCNDEYVCKYSTEHECTSDDQCYSGICHNYFCL